MPGKLPSKRARVKELSNFVITRTEQSLHDIEEFLKRFNEIFAKQKQKTFILGDVDYQFVAIREA